MAADESNNRGLRTEFGGSANRLFKVEYGAGAFGCMINATTGS